MLSTSSVSFTSGFSSISEALRFAPPHHVIVVQPGLIYTESLHLKKPVHIRPDDESGDGITLRSHLWNAIVVDSESCRIERFHIAQGSYIADEASESPCSQNAFLPNSSSGEADSSSASTSSTVDVVSASSATSSTASASSRSLTTSAGLPSAAGSPLHSSVSPPVSRSAEAVAEVSQRHRFFAVHLRAHSSLVISRCTIRSGQLATVCVEAHAQLVMQHSRVLASLSTGVIFLAQAGGLLDHCIIENTNQTAIEIRAKANPTIQHCQIRRVQPLSTLSSSSSSSSSSSPPSPPPPPSCVLFLQESEGVLQHCVLEDSSGYGVRVRANASPMLVQNTVSRCAHDGVHFGVHSGGVAIENVIHSCGAAGVQVSGAAQPTLRGNHISGCVAGAVVVHGRFANPLLEHNHLHCLPALYFGPRTRGVARYNHLKETHPAETGWYRPQVALGTSRMDSSTLAAIGGGAEDVTALVVCCRRAAPLLEHNRLMAASESAIAVSLHPHAAPQLRHNVVRGRIRPLRSRAHTPAVLEKNRRMDAGL
eukprot:CAMPEP_0174247648 /NCGR_PEP_ID=MMETSP0417-20130205/42681_1 /TAXON_ID=242541 /ORGANISM="Mayorella sp, Strain BSH-02190019" /LENGTH=536 /DNA_ID=CAMNT_0015327509 /DNA_START=787 /DNA_END=2397 /DNA_ORIENTATION=-